MEKIINLLKMNFCKKESMSKKPSLETYKSYTLNLEIINLSEVIKFMSPIVDINHFPFDYSWFPKKEEHIQESLKFLKENFMKEYIRRNPDKEISTLSIKKECRILKIYDHEFEQNNSMLIYEYELYDLENNPVIVDYIVEAGYGTIHKSLYIKK